MRSTRRILPLLALALVSAAHAQPLGSAVPPTVDNPNRFAAGGLTAARRFFQLASTRRVDCCIIGDSNTRAFHIGHEGAMAAAFQQRFGCYATGLLPGDGNNWWGDELAYTSCVFFPPFQQEGAPAPIIIRTFTNEGFPSTYGFLPEGTQLPHTFNSGLTIFADSPLDITGPLRYHGTHWVFGPSSTGYVNPVCRAAFPSTPTFNYAAAPTLTTSGSVRQLADFTYDVPAGARDPNGLLFTFADHVNGFDGQGPFLLTWQRVQNTAHTTGVAYSPLWGLGGQAAYHAALALGSSLTPLSEWIRQATRLQNDSPVLLVHVMHGGNDANCHAPSIGPVGGLDSSTPAGQADNTRAIMASIRNAWALSGYDQQNLFFLLGPYHPRPDPDTPIPGYEQQWRDIAAADPQVFTVAGTMLSTTTEFATRDFLSGGVDPYHLSPLGFTTWAQTTLSALNRALCPADFSENGQLAVTDIFAYLDAWFAGSLRADFDYSGALEVQDIFDFLNTWFAGC